MSTRTAIDRMLDVFEALSGNSLHGIAPGKLAKAAGVSPSWVSVTLPALAKRGWVERIEASRGWRLGPRFAEIARLELSELAKAASKCDDLRQRWGG